MRVFLSTCILALLICIRVPQITLKSRFWAEEGLIAFRNAWTLDPAQALFTPFAGYLNIAVNASTLFARWLLPLSLAPYGTIFISLIIQLCPMLLLLTARDAWLQPARTRAAAVLLLLLVPGCDEIWLTTVNSHFELALCCAIILTLDIATGWAAIFHLSLLALAPLCGPIAVALVPLFLLRAIMERRSGRAIQAAVLGTAAAVQLLLFFHALPGRGYTLDPLILLCVLTVRHLEVPFFGMAHADMVATALRARLAAGYIPKQATLLPVLTFGMLAAATLWQRHARPARWFLCAAAIVATASYFGAVGGAATLIDARNSGRYTFVPQALFSLTLLALAATSQGWTARASWPAVVWLLVVGSWEYAHPWPLISDGPAWREEVALWRADPTHALKIWPGGWSITLAPHR